MNLSQDAPIGVFDSGVGGLSVLRAIRGALPGEHLVYIADSAHAPYGDRDPEFVAGRALAIVERLAALGAKAVVIACNTATVIAVERLRARFALPIVAMEPAIKPAIAQSRRKVVGVLATTQTLASTAVARLCERYGQGARILLQPCPGLVEQVERGEIEAPRTRALLAGYIGPLKAAGVDTLVLGCTHYLFVEAAIRELAGPSVAIVESSAAVARELVRRIEGRLSASADPGSTRLLTTAAPDAATQTLIARLWGESISVERL